MWDIVLGTTWGGRESTVAMNNANRKSRIYQLASKIYSLNDRQIYWIESIVSRLSAPKQYELQDSDLFDECMLETFGDALLIHHCLSSESLSKDRFEYLLERVARLCGKSAELAPKGLRGYDIIISSQKFSLKTQADKAIKPDELHISKFMELGKGEWADKPEHLEGLRQQFLEHLDSYDRILSLRVLSWPPDEWHYELVEIPKELLQKAKDGELEMRTQSKQMPKPGYCHVRDENDSLQFQLYFDGGSERKLQIKHLLKSLCRVHATWKFPAVDPYAEP